MRVSRNLPSVYQRGGKNGVLKRLIALLIIVGGLIIPFLYKEKEPSIPKRATKTKLQEISLKLGASQLAALLAQQEKAQKDGFSAGYLNPKIPGEIQHQGKTYPVQIRLHGRSKFHFETAKKFSIRVKVLSSEGPRGIKEFSLIVPAARDYIFNSVFFDLIKSKDILTPATEFVRLKLNEKDLGIYLFEETLNNKIAERAGRPEGTTIFVKGRRECSLLGSSSSYALRICAILATPSSEFEDAVIVGESARSNKVGEKKDLHERAVTVFEGLKSQKLTLSESVDEEKMAELMAIMTIMAASEFDYNDCGFFFNSKTNKLEPLAKQIHISPHVGSWWLNENLDRKQAFNNLFLGDDKFLEKFLKNLYLWTRKGYLEEKLDLLKTKYDGVLLELQNEFKGDRALTWNDFLKKRDWLLVELDTQKPLQIYLKEDFDKKENGFVLFNQQKIPIKPIEILFLDKKGNILSRKPLEDKWLFWKNSIQQNKITSLFVPVPDKKIEKGRIEVLFKMMGSDEVKRVRPFLWKRASSDQTHASNQELRLPKAVFELIWNKKVIKLKGSRVIDEPVLIPPGYTVTVASGANLIFKKSGYILSSSPILAEGTQDEPIRFEFPELGDKPFIRLEGARYPSHFKYVQFTSTNPKQHLAPDLGSAISVTRSNVEVSHCEFSNIAGGWALELIDNRARIFQTHFFNLGRGAIRAIDSELILDDIGIEMAQTYGVLVKSSKATITRLRVSDCRGVAVKADEFSEVDLSYPFITRTHLGIFVNKGSFLKMRNFDLVETSLGIAVGEEGEDELASRVIASVGKFDRVIRDYQKTSHSMLMIDSFERRE